MYDSSFLFCVESIIHPLPDNKLIKDLCRRNTTKNATWNKATCARLFKNLRVDSSPLGWGITSATLRDEHQQHAQKQQQGNCMSLHTNVANVREINKISKQFYWLCQNARERRKYVKAILLVVSERTRAQEIC